MQFFIYFCLCTGTEAPTPSLLDRKPFSKSAPLISTIMWRSIISQSSLQVWCIIVAWPYVVCVSSSLCVLCPITQLIILLIILYGGQSLWGLELHSVNHFTFVFNTFVMMQLFNEINSRKCNNGMYFCVN